jgi:spermidine/putrescine transport system permease protein
MSSLVAKPVAVRRPTRSLPSMLMRAVERIAPIVPMGWLGVFFLAPLAFTVVYAFGHSTFGGVQLAFTFTNFSQALSSFYLHIFLHTIEFAIGGTAITFLIGLPLAYTIARKAGRYKTVLLVLVLIPFWTSFLLRTLSWETLLADGGPIQDAVNFLGLHHGALGWIDSSKAVAVGLVYAYLPFTVIPLFVAFERIPDHVIEASKDLGASRLRTFWHVTLPMARPGVATALLLTFVPMTGEYVVPALLGGNKGVLEGGLIESQYLGSANYPLGSAMAVLLLVVISIVLVVFARLTRSFEVEGQAAT